MKITILAVLLSVCVASPVCEASEGLNPVIQWNPYPLEDAMIGPYTAVIQNDDQSTMHTASVPSLDACRNLARAVLSRRIRIAAQMYQEFADKGFAMSEAYPDSEPDEVLCVPSQGKETTFTPEDFIKELKK